jgi:hypothetical protein
MVLTYGAGKERNEDCFLLIRQEKTRISEESLALWQFVFDYTQLLVRLALFEV